MPTAYQIKDQSTPHYLTFQVVYWIDLFTRQVYRDTVNDSLKYCKREKGLELFAWVIMSNHMHILAKSATGQLISTIRNFKKFTSKAIVQNMLNGSAESRKEWMLRLFQHAAKRQNKSGEYQVWTHENHAIETSGNAFIETKVEYIHENPVRTGSVRNPEDYIYSSATVYVNHEGLINIIPITFRVKTVKMLRLKLQDVWIITYYPMFRAVPDVRYALGTAPLSGGLIFKNDEKQIIWPLIII